VGLGEAATDEIADQLEDAEDALACAIYNADGPTAAADAYRDALDEELSPGYAAVVKLTDISTGIKLLYGGRYDQQDIAQNIVDLGYDSDSFDCTCPGEWACENSLLMDCGFESAGTAGYWVDVGHTPSYPTDAYEGTYCWLMGGTGSGWCASQYTYQELTAPQTGNLKLRFYVKRHQGIYTTKLYLDKWNGSSWVEQRQYTYDDGSSWHISDDNAAVSVTEGDELRVRICNGAYFKLDRLWLFYV
jgi:hypothetical protein